MKFGFFAVLIASLLLVGCVQTQVEAGVEEKAVVDKKPYEGPAVQEEAKGKVSASVLADLNAGLDEIEEVSAELDSQVELASELDVDAYSMASIQTPLR